MPQELQSTEYIAFVSYRHRPLDASVAKKIQKSIERYVVPKEYRAQVGGKRLGKVFRDEDELPASANLSESITHALDHARYLIVICTPDLPQSHWCEEEIRYFLKTHDRDHLLAVLADGEPEISFSPYMLHTFDEEGNITGNVEPLAANLKQPYKKEFIRLVSAMLGCPFDALWQRDRRRKANLRMGIVAGAALLMAAFTSVVLVKNKQINEQKELISAQKAISEQRLSQALVQSGNTKLKNFDQKGALEDALQAIEIEDPEHIDPHVDLLLADALGAYRIHTPVSRIFYEQQQDIVDLKITDDASALVTVDTFGTISYIDRSTGSLLWSYNTNEPWVQVYTQNLGDRLLYKTKEEVRCLSAKDGSEIWSYEQHYGMFFQVLSHDGALFAVMDRIDEASSLSFSDSPLYLILLRTEDGSEYGRVSLTNDAYADKNTNLDGLSEQYGAFSENDKQLILSVRAEGVEEGTDDMGVEVHLFYVIDMDTLEKIKLGRSAYPQDFFYGMDISDDASQAFLAFHSIEYGGIVVCKGIKGTDGYEFDTNIINHDIVTKESGTAFGFYGQYPRFHMLAGPDLYVIISDNRLLLIRKKDNFLFKTYGLEEGIIRSAFWKSKEDRTLEVATSNGFVLELTFKDPDAEGTVMPYSFSHHFEQEQVCLAVHAGESLSDSRSDGRYYSVSESDPGKIICTGYYTDPHARPLFSGADTFDYINEIDCLPDSPWMLIGGSDHNYVVYNKETSEAVHYRNTDIITGYLLLDENHILCGPNVYTIDNGMSQTYCEGDPTDLGLLSYPSNHFRLNTGEIVSYDRSFNDSWFLLRFWIDGKSTDRSLISEYDYESFVFSTSPSGWVVLYGRSGEWKDEQTILWDDTLSFSCLNVLTGEKTTIRNDLPEDRPQILALGNRSQRMAAYAGDGVYVYDLSDTSAESKKASYKDEGVTAITYSDDDRYLLVLTQTGRLDIYDPDTLDLLYSEPIQWIQDEIRATYQWGRYTDPVRNLHASIQGDAMTVFFGRYDSISNGIRVDLKHWVQTAELDGIKTYDPATGEILYWNYETKEIYTFPLYSRDDLKAWAEDIIKE
ncbi:MAG: toll/interleukin-1 receptor domain-containing protein [Clostridiales bacterium]|nr:toll/interleukin-1 receptor domain-containing protein [Clostridiales bacterium]